ncbi:hypothetical protein CTI12_AA096080 [Artemisia annua]|uniref:Uncharacterized protein n=1 Tax=Artemisia annua TaxID=35608 RepID=A0A2U1PYM5_ARTAN|nr:hypothetical protein CTI12_AA096080 [Artemisia annua]
MANVAILHSRSSLTNNQDNTITPAPTKSPQPVRTHSRYIIPARRTVDKENIKPPVTVNVQKHPKVYKGYVDFDEFSKVLARCRRIKEYAEKNKVGTKEVDLTMKNCASSNHKRVSDQDINECFAGFMFPDSPNPSALPLPTSLIKKTMV